MQGGTEGSAEEEEASAFCTFCGAEANECGLVLNMVYVLGLRCLLGLTLEREGGAKELIHYSSPFRGKRILSTDRGSSPTT